MPLRGTYNFEISSDGDILYSQKNVELLRKLWLDKEIIKPGGLGPGDPGDFDNGAWHVACHLVAGGCVRKTQDGRIVWLEISYDENKKIYFSSLTIREKDSIETLELNNPVSKDYLKGSKLLGFVEGTSEGRISAKGVKDDEKLFNGSLRQEYDQEPGNLKEGGKVWEHWCTTRDIRNTSIIGYSVIDSYVSLVSASGDKFVSIIARGRIDYEHPAHLKAMVTAGFTSKNSAQFNIYPIPIPENINLIFQNGDTLSNFIASERLEWDNTIKYYMFSRRINRWCE